MSEGWGQDVLQIVNKLMERRDCEPFRKPVPWKELGLMDYLSIVKCPMDLGTIQKRIKRMEYQKREDCIQQIRLVWANAMKYNLPGSKVYNTANTLSELFEAQLQSKFTGRNRLPTIQDYTSLIENCHKLNPTELGNMINLLDKKCPSCLRKAPDSNEVFVDVDLIPPAVCQEVRQMISAATSLNGARSSSSSSANKSESSGGGKRSNDSTLDESSNQSTSGPVSKKKRSA